MRTVLLILLNAALVLVPAAPGFARILYQSDLICADNPEARGYATISQNGDLFINLSGVTPQEHFDCAVVCRDLITDVPFAFNAIPWGTNPSAAGRGCSTPPRNAS